MTTQQNINYTRIAKAIEYIKTHFKEQPELDKIAEHVHLSPAHFQRLFTDWAGTSPKKFLQYISLAYAKALLTDSSRATLFNTALNTGLSSTSRLHELFVNIEGMTPAEYKHGGKGLSINYSYADTPFGSVIVASTTKGVCYIAFHDDERTAFNHLQSKFPNAVFIPNIDQLQRGALSIFSQDWTELTPIKLHLKGTEFQLKVWEALLKIPLGKLCTYGTIAKDIGMPTASRAIGTAIGSNPIAFLIPCHRVIQSTGLFGGYMWGNTRKTAIIGWEGAKVNLTSP